MDGFNSDKKSKDGQIVNMINATKSSTPEENGSSSENDSSENFDQILEKVGSEGKYQKSLLYWVLLPMVAMCPFLIFNNIFMWDVPDHWCHVPGKDSSMSLEQWKNLTLPLEEGSDGLMRYSQCKMYDTKPNGERNIVSCQSGWEYDTTDYSSTIPSEFNWVCDKDHYPTDAYTWITIGSGIGTVLFGMLSDKFGRKPVLFLAVGCNALFKTASLFVPQYYTLYKFLQLLGGMGFPAAFSLPALIIAEMSGSELRGWVYAASWMITVVGNVSLPFVAMISRGWFLFGCISAIPGFIIILLLYPRFEESPQWLLTTGKTKECLKILLKIAKENGKTVNAIELEGMLKNIVKQQNKEKEKEGQSVGLLTLFSKPRLAKNTVLLMIVMTMNGLLYNGVILNTTNMSGNIFTNYFLLALVELPSGWLGGKLVDITGRRWTQTGFYIVATVSCIVCWVAVTIHSSASVVILGAIGIKLGVGITDMIGYIQGTEIFPTQLRSTGTGLASTVACAIGIFGPYIAYSGTFHISFPYICLCIVAIIGLVAGSNLPETFQQKLPETVEDANEFGKEQKFWCYLPQGQKKTKQN